MSSQDNGSSTNSGSGLKDSFGNLWSAATNPEILRARRADAGRLGSQALDSLTQIMNGQNPFASTPTPPPVVPPADAGASGSAESPEGTPRPPGTPAPAAAAAPKPEEDTSWIANILFTMLPDGVKEWAATASIPLATQGQHLIGKFGKPKVSASPAAYFTCMTGDKITEVPQSVHDYAKKIIKMLGLGENEDLAMSISVGFISFLRDKLSGIVPGIKCFESASTGPAKPSDLIGFATNTQTLLGLFKLAPKDELVDPALLMVFKGAFKEKGVATIDNYFPDGDMSYGQFVEAYATMGRDLIREGKWTVDASKITDEMRETTSQIFNKYGISDPDGYSLAEGLILSSIQSSEMIKAFAATPPTAPSTAGNRPAAGATGR